MQKAPVPRPRVSQEDLDRAYKMGLHHGKYLRTYFGLFSLVVGIMFGFIVGLIIGYYTGL